MKKVIITIPAYNEEKTLPAVLAELKAVMTKTKYKYSILVLDDGSSDKTARVARKAGTIVQSNPRNMGLAETFRREMTKCLDLRADIIVHTDADGQYPAKFIPHMIKKIEDGNDLVLGTRFGKGQYKGSFMKNLGNRAFATTFSKLMKRKVTDTTTGFRAFTGEVARLPLINKFTYTQEQLLRAWKNNMQIAEVPISTKKTRESRLFKNPFQYAFKAWVNILRIYRDYEPLKFFSYIALPFFLIAIALAIYVLHALFTGQGIDDKVPSIILIAIFFLTSLQIALFGFLADMNKN